jgi:hypothetical protein
MAFLAIVMCSLFIF